MKLALPVAFVAAILALPLHAADSASRRITEILGRDQTEQAALSPDGRYLAYTLREGDRLDLLVTEVGPSKIIKRMVVGKAAAARSSILNIDPSPKKLSSEVRQLKWATSDWLVYAVEDATDAVSKGFLRVELRSFNVTNQKELRLANGDADARSLVPPLPPSRAGRAGATTMVSGETRVIPTPDGTSAATMTTQITPQGNGSVTVVQPDGSISFSRITVSPQPSNSAAQVPVVGQPGNFALLGFRTDDPLKAILETRPYNSKLTTLLQVDVSTGTTTRAAAFETETFQNVLYDQQFRPRFTRSTHVSGMLGRSSTPAFYNYTTERDTDWEPAAILLGRNLGYFRNLGEEHLVPLAFDRDPNVLYVASNRERDTFGIYALDLTRIVYNGLTIEDEAFDQGSVGSPVMQAGDLFIYDRAHRLAGVSLRGMTAETRWLDPKLAVWQTRLEDKFPDEVVRIREWSNDYKRVLAEVTSASNPGSFIVVEDGAQVQLKTSVPQSSGSRTKAFSPAGSFAFLTDEGVRLTGAIVMPTGVKSPPLLLYCHDIPEDDDRPASYDPNPKLQAMAALGIAVAEVNYRGSSGLGLSHLSAGKPGLDRLAAADLRAAAAWLSSHYTVAKGQVGLIGLGFGGYIALRAAQLYPDDFRAVVAIEPTTDPSSWIVSMESNRSYSFDPVFLGGRNAQFTDLRAVAGAIRARVLLIHEPAPSTATPPRIPTSQIAEFRDALRKAGRAVEWVDLAKPFPAGTPSDRTETFTRIGRFLEASFKAKL